MPTEQSQRPTVELLIGPIASGKSTYSKRRATEGAIIVNDDAIVMALHADQYNLYNINLKPLYKAIENSILQMAIMLGKDVIIDRPNYSKAMRSRYISIARSLDAAIKFTVFPAATPEEHARRRTHSDSRGYGIEYWVKVCKHHMSLYETPVLSEGADSIWEMRNGSDMQSISYEPHLAEQIQSTESPKR